MEELQKTSAGQGITIIGVLLAFIGMGLSFVPAVSYGGLIPGAIGIILCIMGFREAAKENGPKILIRNAIIIAIACTVIGFIWIHFISGNISESGEEIDVPKEEQIEEKLKDIEK